MPLLGALISGLFFSLVNFFTEVVTRKVAVYLALVGIFVTVTAAFFVAMKALVTGIYAVAPEYLSIAVSWFVPYNFNACISAIITAKLLRWTYDWKTKITGFKKI